MDCRRAAAPARAAPRRPAPGSRRRSPRSPCRRRPSSGLPAPAPGRAPPAAARSPPPAPASPPAAATAAAAGRAPAVASTGSDGRGLGGRSAGVAVMTIGTGDGHGHAGLEAGPDAGDSASRNCILVSRNGGAPRFSGMVAVVHDAVLPVSPSSPGGQRATARSGGSQQASGRFRPSGARAFGRGGPVGAGRSGVSTLGRRKNTGGDHPGALHQLVFLVELEQAAVARPVAVSGKMNKVVLLCFTATTRSTS